MYLLNRCKQRWRVLEWFCIVLPVVDRPSKTHWLAEVAVLFSERTTPPSYTLCSHLSGILLVFSWKNHYRKLTAVASYNWKIYR